jgi:hypothetical protein
MSQTDLWAVVGRARLDAGFARQLLQDFEGTIKAQGYSLSADELQSANAALSGAAGPQEPASSVINQASDAFNFQQAEMQRRIKAQGDHMISLNKFTADTLQETIRHSASTYQKVTLMNQTMFWMGVGLFIFAVFYAVAFHNLNYSVAFAGLGTVSFIGFFFLGPIQKTQVALSNLIQAEIAFMTFFEQMSLIEAYAGIPRDDNPGLLDPVRMEQASNLFQKRSEQTIELLEKYLENDPGRAEDLAKQGKDASVPS